MRHPHPGVQLPEQQFRDNVARKQILGKLTVTPGTFCYTGPMTVVEAPAPTEMEQVLSNANKAEMMR